MRHCFPHLAGPGYSHCTTGTSHSSCCLCWDSIRLCKELAMQSNPYLWFPVWLTDHPFHRASLQLRTQSWPQAWFQFQLRQRVSMRKTQFQLFDCRLERNAKLQSQIEGVFNSIWMRFDVWVTIINKMSAMSDRIGIFVSLRAYIRYACFFV